MGRMFAGYAVVDSDTCYLFRVAEHGIDYTEPDLPPPEWPELVSEEFLEENGFVIHHGTLKEWQEAYSRTLKQYNFVDVLGILEREKREYETKINRQKAILKQMREREKKLSLSIYDLESRLSGFKYSTPSPPVGIAVTRLDKDMIPEGSGCYFAWEGVVVRYVGKAVNLRKRLTGAHHAVTDDHLLTWIEIPVDDLYFAEAYYIGTLRPRMNKAKPVIQRES